MKLLLLKTLIMTGVSVGAAGLGHCQRSRVFDNLDSPSAGSVPVARDARAGALFFTGTDAPWVALNSLVLPRPEGHQDWSSLRPAIYVVASSPIGDGYIPGRLVGVFTPTTSPQDKALKYVADGIVLVGGTNKQLPMYSLVLGTDKPMTEGFYPWRITDNWVPGEGAWSVRGTIIEISASNGTQWDLQPGVYPQFAFEATPIPEPSPAALLALGGVGFLLARRKRRTGKRADRFAG